VTKRRPMHLPSSSPRYGLPKPLHPAHAAPPSRASIIARRAGLAVGVGALATAGAAATLFNGKAIHPRQAGGVAHSATPGGVGNGSGPSGGVAFGSPGTTRPAGIEAQEVAFRGPLKLAEAVEGSGGGSRQESAASGASASGPASSATGAGAGSGSPVSEYIEKD